MIVMLANENAASEGAPEGDQADMVACAQRWLIAHPESCKYLSQHDSGIPKGGEKKHEHGSSRCVSAFLGPTNWTQTTVTRLLVVDTLHESAKEL